MKLLKFYWRVLAIAFTRTPSITQDILFGLFVIAGVILYFLKKMDMIADEASWMHQVAGWQIATIVLGAIFVCRLMLAPYWLYKRAVEVAGAGRTMQSAAELQRLGAGIADDRRALIQKIGEMKRAVSDYRGDKMNRFFLGPRRIISISGGLEDRFMGRTGFDAKWKAFRDAAATCVTAAEPDRSDFGSSEAHTQAVIVNIHQSYRRLDDTSRDLIEWLMSV